jgi:hypothetical protein
MSILNLTLTVEDQALLLRALNFEIVETDRAIGTAWSSATDGEHDRALVRSLRAHLDHAEALYDAIEAAGTVVLTALIEGDDQ